MFKTFEICTSIAVKFAAIIRARGPLARIAVLNIGLGGVCIALAGCASFGGILEKSSGNIPAALAISWPSPSPIINGTALSATQLDATANVPGTLIYSPGLGTVLGAGSQILSVSFTPTNIVNYSATTAKVSLAVTAAVESDPGRHLRSGVSICWER